jgi:alpha-galactosidase
MSGAVTNRSHRWTRVAGVSLILALAAAVCHAEVVSLSKLDLRKIQQARGFRGGFRGQGAGTQVPLTIAGQKFEDGVRTFGASTLWIDLGQKAKRFTALVGVDDLATAAEGTATFQVYGDAKERFNSGPMKANEAARKVDVDLSGAKYLLLQIEIRESDNANRTNRGDTRIPIVNRTDWADAKIEYEGTAPVTVDGPAEEAVILTPKPSPKPQINGAKVFGVRPGNPFQYTIAATGDRPMTFSVEGLPAGLAVNATTGIITGVLKDKGEYTVTLRAKNALGTAERRFKIVCGPTIGLTPALGWNSWNCFASAVTAEKIRAAADAMVSSGLIQHGWTYINIDDYWEVNPRSKDPTLQGPQRDAEGRILPNPRFPNMKELTDYVHALGLKIGLYSGPGPLTCGGCIASYQHEEQDAKTYGEWGFDYLKYDWCSYSQIAPPKPGREDLMKPYLVMRAALDKVPRDIIYSLCQYGMGKVWEWGAEVGGNSWRTTGDITDTWISLSNIGFAQGGHEKYVGPGHFDDPDMLIVGKVGWGPRLHPTRLTPNEQYTHISLWCLLCSPLLIGCDMTQMDDFTLNLLTNDEVLEINQDPLGHQASCMGKEGPLEVWAKKMEDGSKAVGLFNRSEFEAPVKATWQTLGLSGRQKVRDLWRQKDLGVFSDQFEAKVPRHGVVLVRIAPAK